MNAIPLPPPELADYIYGGVNPDEALKSYVRDGEVIKRELLRLGGADWSFEGRRVLDFGCGSGRVLRQFVDEARVCEFHGCELDEACVSWLQANLCPPFIVERSEVDPPLPYSDDFFDLVWATAVLSHLPDNWAEWLIELHRVLKPGGMLIATTLGEQTSEIFAGEPWIEDRIGMNVLGYGKPWEAGGPVTLHSEWWLRAHWGRLFEIEKFETGGMMGQDALVMRPRDVVVDAAALRAPEPDEPRELTAAQHSIEQLHRENRALNESHDAYAKAYADESAKRAALEKRSTKGVLRKLSGRA
jgi:SAM-dependent methyltransferase